MYIKRIIKKYKKASNKARKLWEKIDTYYMNKYMDNDREVCKQIINELYSAYTPSYMDSDSLILSSDFNFNKKQET